MLGGGVGGGARRRGGLWWRRCPELVCLDPGRRGRVGTAAAWSSEASDGEDGETATLGRLPAALATEDGVPDLGLDLGPSGLDRAGSALWIDWFQGLLDWEPTP